MSDWPQDILERIRTDFPQDTELVDSMLRDLESAGVPERNRVARCVLDLAEVDLDRFRNIHKAACQDYRDVIWWAESARVAYGNADKDRWRQAVRQSGIGMPGIGNSPA